MSGRLLAVVVAVLAWSAAPAHAIVGGTPATEPYPWMASLQVEGSHICGGSLIRPDTVLTAAHCVVGEKADTFSILLGTTRLSAPDGERIGVKSIEVHEAFETDPAGGHDIALVRLERPSQLTTIDIVAPAQDGLWAPGSPVRVIGWGSAVFAIGPGSDDLLQADVEIIGDQECASSYDGIANFGFDPATQLCAGRQVIGLEDSCQGDSGGPLMARSGTGWVQVGAVSQGLGCGFPLFYGVYSRLGSPALRTWLDEHVDNPGTVPPAPAAKRSDVNLDVARVRVKRRAVRVRVRSSAPVTAVRATLRRKGRIVGRGGLPRISRRGTIKLSVRAKRPRRANLRIRATDAGGGAVRHRERVSLRR